MSCGRAAECRRSAEWILGLIARRADSGSGADAENLVDRVEVAAAEQMFYRVRGRTWTQFEIGLAREAPRQSTGTEARRRSARAMRLSSGAAPASGRIRLLTMSTTGASRWAKNIEAAAGTRCRPRSLLLRFLRLFVRFLQARAAQDVAHRVVTLAGTRIASSRSLVAGQSIPAVHGFVHVVRILHRELIAQRLRVHAA